MPALFQPTPHPVIPVPTLEWARAAGAACLKETLARREEVIRRERANPIVCGWEPPVWRLCDALLGFPWVPDEMVERVQSWFGQRIQGRDDGVKLMRKIRFLLIQGANRAGKTEYMVRTAVRLCLEMPAIQVWMFHSTHDMSTQWHHAGVYKFLPEEMKVGAIRSEVAYMSYKQLTGFGSGAVVFPAADAGTRGSQITFRNYAQDDTTLEGADIDLVLGDELMPLEWLDRLKTRTSTRDGRMILGFTPIQGYTGAVKRVIDGAETLLEVPAWLLPRDGGDKLEALALGLEVDELAELERAAQQKRAATAPAARPYPFNEVFGTNVAMPAAPVTGREFRTVPRVQKGVVPDEAIVYFHSMDNPYGNPRGVFARNLHRSDEHVAEVLYGVGHKLMASRFPRFDPAVHVLPEALIPGAGTNYHVLDPADGRNIFMLWLRVTPWAAYVYRECPGDYYLEGIGVPGPWALPDGKLADGRRGPAQESFGWGYVSYKKLIGRLEGWESLKEGPPAGMSEGDWVKAANPHGKAAEVIAERRIDSRYANASRVNASGVTTMLEEFADVNLPMYPTDVMREEEGIQQITDALDYNEAQPVNALNTPHLFIAASCRNLIFALQTWTGRDGMKGATLDPIATLRMFYQCKLGCRGEGEDTIQSTGGGFY